MSDALDRPVTVVLSSKPESLESGQEKSVSKNRRDRGNSAAAMVIALGATLGGCGDRTPPKSAEQLATEQRRNLQLQEGAAAVDTLRGAMRDPHTFQLASARVMNDGATCIEYRATNAFGGWLTSRAVAVDGRMLTQEHDSKRFVDAWNARCVQSGTDIAPWLWLNAGYKRPG